MKGLRLKTACAVAATSVALVLSGCGPVSPESTPTPTATTSPSASPSPAALVIPDCESLVPIELARSSFSEFTEYLGELSPARYIADLQNPELVAASTDVSRARVCLWGIPNSDGGFSLFIAGGADGARIQGALTADGYSSVTMGTVTGLEATVDTEVGSQAETHLFTGDVWIVAKGTSLSLTGIIAGAGLDGMRTANPSLDL